MNEDHMRMLNDCEIEIDSIRSWINKNRFDDKVRFLVAYSVIKSAGTLEYVFKSIVYCYLTDGCKEEAKTYLEANIVDASCNVNTGNMTKMLEQINTEKSNQFSEGVKKTQCKNDLNSLVSLRNDLAHGRTISVSVDTVNKYFLSGKRIVHFVDDLLMNCESVTVLD